MTSSSADVSPENINYNNVDFTNTTLQKMMSLSIGPDNSLNQSQYITNNQNMSNMTSSFIFHNDPVIFTVALQPNGGPLGITLAGNEDGQKPIIVSGLLEGGVAFNTQQMQIGDCLLAINDESVVGKPLSNATRLLQSHSEGIELKLSRGGNIMSNSIVSVNDQPPNPLALYAQVQRRPRSPVNIAGADGVSNASSNQSSGSENNKTILVTLYKDQVYDDYGFSVSDGLYEVSLFDMF